jgi:PPIC-type PPIASE domain
MTIIQRWIREPLLHFLILGALLFVVFHVVKGNSTQGQVKIVVTTGTIRTLAENFQSVWQRPPTRGELDGLIQDYIKEEVYYREAQNLGLEKDDPIIRRRLRQKMEFLGDGMAATAEPTDRDLQSYLEKHPEKFQVESRYTFTHVYLNPEHHQNSLKQDATKLLAELNKAGGSVDSSKYGDSFMLGYNFSNVPETRVARTFGPEFAKNLSKQQVAKWVGPIESGYGEHLVYIGARSEGQTPSLSEVRDKVQREWMSDQQKQAGEKFFDGLRARYQITIEQPQKSDSKDAEAESQK